MIKKTLLLSGINLTGKVLGLLKVIILASIYGAGSVYDAFIVAYTLPTLLPQILTTIITTIFIPQFHKMDRSTKESWNGLNTLFTFVVLLSLVTTVVLYVFSYQIVTTLAPGLDQDVVIKAVSLFKIMSISTFLIGISGFFISLSHAQEKFYLASWDGLIINSVIIFYCINYPNFNDITAIAKLIVLGFLLHLILLIISNWKMVFKFIRFRLACYHEDFLQAISKSVPIIVGYIGAVITGIVDQWFSSFEGSGSISVLSYATMIYLLPMDVFGKSLMQTYFAKFSNSTSDTQALLSSYYEGFRLIIFIIVPISLFLLLSNKVLISLIFERGSFTSSNAHQTSLILSAFGFGLLFRIIAFYNYRLLHAVDKSWVAITTGLIGVVANVILNYFLSRHYGLVGIAFATTISLLFSAFISCLLIKKYYKTKYLNFINLNLVKIIFLTLSVLLLYNWTTTLVLPTLYLFSKDISNIYDYVFLTMLPIVFLIFGYLMNIREIVDASSHLRGR